MEQKWKMKEVLTNLGCLWGGRGPVLQPHPLRNSAETAISAILTFLGSLWGEVEVLLLLDTSFGDRPPSHWWWRNCRISDEYFWRSGIPRKSDEYFWGQAIPHKYLTNTGSCLFWGEFRPSRKFSNTFDVEIPHSDQDIWLKSWHYIYLHILIGNILLWSNT